jgi:sugar phosphate permease
LLAKDAAKDAFCFSAIIAIIIAATAIKLDKDTPTINPICVALILKS